jgi:peptidoglycan hydrolase-like protein with peptidoglycan-binding domain
MTAKKRTAKKAAAPKTVDQPDVSGVGEVTASGTVGTVTPPESEPLDALGEFPLPEGHYLHPPVVSPLAHDGSTEVGRNALIALQGRLGAPQTGVYDDETERLMLAWRAARGLPLTPIVDNETWQALRRG